MNNLNFCGIFEDLTMDAINKGSGSEAPILLLEEDFDNKLEDMMARKAPDISDFKANEILKELEDLQKHVKAFNEVQERYLDRLERHYERIEKESEGK